MTRKDAPNSAGLTDPFLYAAPASNPHRGTTTFEEARELPGQNTAGVAHPYK